MIDAELTRLGSQICGPSGIALIEREEYEERTVTNIAYQLTLYYLKDLCLRQLLKTRHAFFD